jgi:hypothetical protein
MQKTILYLVASTLLVGICSCEKKQRKESDVTPKLGGSTAQGDALGYAGKGQEEPSMAPEAPEPSKAGEPKLEEKPANPDKAENPNPGTKPATGNAGPTGPKLVALEIPISFTEASVLYSNFNIEELKCEPAIKISRSTYEKQKDSADTRSNNVKITAKIQVTQSKISCSFIKVKAISPASNSKEQSVSDVYGKKLSFVQEIKFDENSSMALPMDKVVFGGSDLISTESSQPKTKSPSPSEPSTPPPSSNEGEDKTKAEESNAVYILSPAEASLCTAEMVLPGSIKCDRSGN